MKSVVIGVIGSFLLWGCVEVDQTISVDAKGHVTDRLVIGWKASVAEWLDEETRDGLCRKIKDKIRGLSLTNTPPIAIETATEKLGMVCCTVTIGPYQPDRVATEALEGLGIVIESVPDGFVYIVPNFAADLEWRKGIVEALVADLESEADRLPSFGEIDLAEALGEEVSTLINESLWRLRVETEKEGIMKRIDEGFVRRWGGWEREATIGELTNRALTPTPTLLRLEVKVDSDANRETDDTGN